ncbi:MAG TPA: sensor histidine kinase N-terminal domain-containing protein, partial [Vulgatibacter sp.]
MTVRDDRREDDSRAERKSGISLQTRLALVVGTLCLVLTLLVGLVIWHAVRQASVEALDRELATSADVLSRLVHLDKDGSIDVEDHADGKLAIAHRIETTGGEVLSEGGLRWREIAIRGGGTEVASVDGHPWRITTRTLELRRKEREARVVLRVAT